MRKFFLSAFVAVAAPACLGTPAITSNPDSGGSSPATGGGSGGSPVATTGGVDNASSGGPATGGSGAVVTAGTSSASGSGGTGSGGTGSGGSAGAAGSGMGGSGGGGGSSSAGMAGTGGAGDATLPALRLDDVCGSLLGGNVCLHADKPSDNGTPFMKMASATMGGAAGTTYMVKLHIRGVVEPTHVQGGTPGTPAQFVTGGQRYADGSNESTYQQWRLTTTVPNQHYFLNVYTEGLSHVVHIIDFMETIPIGGGSTVTLDVYDGNAHSISNTVNNPPLSITGIPGSMMSGQFVQIDAM